MQRTCAVCGRQFEHPPKAGRPPLTCSPECQRIRRTRLGDGIRAYHASRQDCPPDKHGTSTGYSFYKCDCPKCSRWARLYKQERRAKAKRRPRLRA
jgi:hypothetical protein